MRDKMYTIEEIKSLVKPVAKQYGIERIFLFGSYANGDAGHDSDIDLRIDSGALRGYVKLAGFRRELEEILATQVDVLTTGSLDEEFLARISGEEIVLYE